MPLSAVETVGDVPVEDLPHKLGLAEDLERLKSDILDWIGASSAEVRDLLRWQFVAKSKYFRPFMIFACHRAVSDEPMSPRTLRSAVALELFHNVSLIVDDLVDHSRYRRGKLTLHCRFGELPALMTAGFITAAGFRMVAGDAYGVRLLGELMQRLGVAECLQWRLRRRPLGIEDWRAIAGEDTGSMFEICAALGTRNDRLRKFGRLLGMVYHGCDDVGDMRGAAALGGGGDHDLRDGILTLPVAIAIRHPETAALFRNPGPDNTRMLLGRILEALPEAERYLDGLAAEAEAEARRHARHCEPLLELLHYVRALSQS